MKGRSAGCWAAIALWLCATAACAQDWTAHVTVKNYSQASIWVTFLRVRDFPAPNVTIATGCLRPGEGQIFIGDVSWSHAVRAEMTKTADCSALPNNSHVVCDASADVPKMGLTFNAYDMAFTADANACRWTAGRPGTLEYLKSGSWGAAPQAAPPSHTPGPLTSKGESLGNGQALAINEYLQSPSKRYYAIMQTDGNLCVYKGTPQASQGGIWCHNKTWPRGPFVTVMQSDGNLCTYLGTSAGYQANLWCSNAVAAGASYATMQNDGNLCVYRGTPASHGAALWCHNTNVEPPPSPPPPPPPPAPGPLTSKGEFLASGQTLVTNQYLQSPGNLYYAIMQTDGNLCVYKGTPQASRGGIWCHNRTAPGSGPFVTVMQSDGNLCTYVGTPTGYQRNLWCSNAVAAGGTYVTMQTDGNLCVYPGQPYHATGRAIWCHNTNVGR